MYKRQLSRVCASTAYANGATGGDNVKIAILDTGLNLQADGDIGHAEFGTVGSSSSNVVLGTLADVYAWDAVPEDDDGHGTHVAGIIGAQKTGYNMHGVAYDAILYPVSYTHLRAHETDS